MLMNSSSVVQLELRGHVVLPAAVGLGGRALRVVLAEESQSQRSHLQAREQYYSHRDMGREFFCQSNRGGPKCSK